MAAGTMIPWKDLLELIDDHYESCLCVENDLWEAGKKRSVKNYRSEGERMALESLLESLEEMGYSRYMDDKVI